MNETVQTQKILDKLLAITSEIGVIGKTNKNSFQNYNFRSVSQAMAALQPLLVKHGVVLQPNYTGLMLHQQEKGFTATCTLHLTFYCVEDQSSLMITAVGQGADSGDKALYKAMAGAFKYGVFQTFCIPEDGADAEFSEPEVKAKKPAAKSTGATGPSIRNLLD